MAGPWDALGRGIESGMQAFLTGKQRQEDVKTRAAAEAMERERLGLEKFRTQTAIDQYAQEQALAEQLRAEERHGRYDPRTDLTRGIFIPMYKDMGEGVRVPTTQAERDQMYTEGIAAWEAKEAGLAGEEHQRRLEEIEYAARMGHKYSYPPAYTQEKEPDFVRQLYRGGILDSETAAILTVRALQQFMPAGIPINPSAIFAGRDGKQLAHQVATYVAQLSGTYYPNTNVYADFMRFLEGYNPAMAAPVQSARTPGPPPEFTEATRQSYAQTLQGAPNIPGVSQTQMQGLLAPAALPPGTTPPGMAPPAPIKKLADFEAEVAAEQPHLKSMPAAVTMIAQNRYQEYLKSLKSQPR